MRALLDALAVGCAAGAALLLAVATVRGRRRLGLGVALDLVLAAGLLRLSGDVSWARIASVAAVLALRLLLVADLRAAEQAHPV